MTLESKMKRMFSSIIILVGLMVAFSAHAWMDDWAPAFNCTPAEAEELSEANVGLRGSDPCDTVEVIRSK